MDELNKLVKEQAEDDASDTIEREADQHNHHHYLTVMSMAKLTRVADAIQAKKADNYVISWGEPADICMARMDKRCPVCNKTRKNGFELDEESAYCPERTNSQKYPMSRGKSFDGRFGFDLTESHFTF